MNAHSPASWVMGIDIAAASFVATWEAPTHPTHQPRTVQRTESALHAFVHDLAAAGIDPDHTRVAMEATGSYWIRVAVALHTAGYTVCVLNPHHVHHFAKSLPRHAKTDRIDAQIIRQFAVERQPPAWTPPPVVYHELRQQLMARDALLEMRQQARNQRHALRQWPVIVDAVVAHFEAVLQTIDTELAAIVTASGIWSMNAKP